MKNSKNILIVDDKSSIRKMLIFILEKTFSEMNNILIFEADNGEIAVGMIELIEPVIVVSDIDMPRMDGIALLKETQRKFPQTSFIMMSGRSDYQKKVEELGAIFMQKPFDLGFMAEAVKEKILKK